MWRRQSWGESQRAKRNTHRLLDFCTELTGAFVRGLRLPGLSAFASKLQYQHRQLRPQYLGPPLADLDLTRAALQPVLHPEAGQPDHSAGEGLAAGRGDRDNSYICRNCGKGFAYSHSMIRHRRKCEGTYHLSCQFCGKQFHRRDLYAEHLASNHNAVDSDSQRMHRHALFEVQQAAEDSAIIRDMQEAGLLVSGAGSSSPTQGGRTQPPAPRSPSSETR